MNEMNRRDFFKLAGIGAAGIVAANLEFAQAAKRAKKETEGATTADTKIVTAGSVPSYLKGYEELYKTDPRAAAMQWLKDAKFGLFVHYGLYSLLGRHEWVQQKEKIPVAEYAKLKDKFTAEKFDANFIADLAVEAQMKYITITTRHHDGFCLWNSKGWDFNSVNSPAKRDLVAELAEACRKKNLGLSLYYSHGRDWKHPDAPNNDEWKGSARPNYKPAEPSYHYGKDHDMQRYLDFMTDQIDQLLTNYGPIMAIWLDGIAVPKSGDKSKFKCQELYDMIRSKQPQVLVSYKNGLLGTEDFSAPERSGTNLLDPSKPTEICDTLQPQGWGYMIADEGKHKTADQVMTMLAKAAGQKANLLLNTGPLPSGEVHPDDVKTLKEVGRRIKADGWPKPIVREAKADKPKNDKPKKKNKKTKQD